ncbi:MAG: DUF4831 family protein [Muribaculaceae bacterium]
MKFTAIMVASLAMCATLHMSAQTTQKFTAAKHNEYGLTYSMPITHLKVVVEAQKTVKKAGPYYKYAKKYLGTDNVITQDSQEWDLKSVDMWSYGVPNDDNQYLMQFKPGTNVFVTKSEDGLLLSINTENVQAPEQSRKSVTEQASVLNDNSYVKALPGELLVSASTAKRAEIAAQQIYKIRESRTNLATGEADQMPPDGAAMKLVLQQLDEQEAALTALFLGTVQTGTEVKVYDYVPDTIDVKNHVLMRISDQNGMVDADDLSGEPLYLTMTVIEQGELPVDDKGVEKKLPKGAIIYNMPGKAEFTLQYNAKRVARKTFNVAQLGVEFGLDPTLFSNKKAPSFVKFHPETGAVMEIGAVQLPEQK